MGEAEFPRYVFGIHDPGGESLMAEKHKRGWIVFTHELGHDPSHHGGFDYRRWTEAGYGAIARLNNGYGQAGTIPLPEHYDRFARRVRNWVEASPGCHVWIIGNEMNHQQERPQGQPITPDMYAFCYDKCWQQIHSLPDRAQDQVTIGAVAPWNNTTPYPGNENGDWVQYFVDVIHNVQRLGGSVDAISLHTYTHGSDPALVFSDAKMGPPFQNRYFNFYCYRDFMQAIPDDLRQVPVYITETNQDVPWENVNRGWVQNAYKEIDDWNRTAGNQQIRSLVLYRWQFDKWHLDDKTGVHDDFRMAMNHEYTWRAPDRVQVINGHEVRDPFLAFFEELGESTCGLPISDEIVENGLRTQYFERLVPQADPSGQVILKPVGVEVLALRKQVSRAEQQILDLRAQLAECRAELEQCKSSRQLTRPALTNMASELLKHPTKRYKRRDLQDINYLVIGHSAVPDTVTASAIAQFHVKHMQWPGIGFHFYIDGRGKILQTNPLTTISYHVGEWDPISVGICVGGNFTAEIPKPAQLDSTARLVAWLLQELRLPIEAVRGKSEFVATQSPGLQWLSGKRWKDLLLDKVRNLVG
jgi:hypothetical protein